MLMRPDIQIQSMIKALTDNIIPALPPENTPAQEQAKLMLGLLALMRTQLPLQFRFDCDELERLIGLSQTLREIDSEGMDEIMLQSEAEAKRVLEGARSSPADLQLSIRQLRSEIGQRITRLYPTVDSSDKARLQELIIETSREQLIRDRSLLLQQGWEPYPEALPSIESLLGIESVSTKTE